MLKYSALLLLLVLVLGSCRKEPHYPNTPEIEFKRIEQVHLPEEFGIRRDEISIVIGFRDGDGNLGLSARATADTTAPFNEGSQFYNNFVVNLLIRQQNPAGDYTFVPYEFPVEGFDLSGRFPRISNDERQEPLEGEIKYTMREEFTSDLFNPGDVIKFEVFIYDRNLPIPNKSNVVMTDEVTLFGQ